jgi:hypothetical protein
VPATFSHPAAVLLLQRFCGRWLDLSALVVGSVTPDLGYFVLLTGVARGAHEPWGLLFVCLPLGLLAWLALHGLGPLLAPLVSREAGVVLRLGRRAGEITWPGFGRAGASVLLGAGTHVGWDSMTHEHTWFSDAVPAMLDTATTLGGYEIPVHYVAQHASSLLGLAFVVAWMRRRLREAAAEDAGSLLATDGPSAQHDAAAALWRRRVWRWAIALGVCVGLPTGLWIASEYEGTRALRAFLFRGVVHTMSVSLALALGASAWRLWRRASSSASATGR